MPTARKLGSDGVAVGGYQTLGNTRLEGVKLLSAGSAELWREDAFLLTLGDSRGS